MSREKVIGYEYDKRFFRWHPITNEPMPPPIILSAVVDEESIGWARSTLVKVNESRGWVGEYFEKPLYREDGEQGCQ